MITRRELLGKAAVLMAVNPVTGLPAGSGGLVVPRADQGYAGSQGQAAVSPGSPNVVRARQVIVSGLNEGIFIYNGTPALGNLIASFTGVAGTDAFGNAFLGGNVTYQGGGSTFFALVDVGGALAWYVAGSVRGPWVNFANIGSVYNNITATGYASLSNAQVSSGDSWQAISRPAGLSGTLRVLLDSEDNQGAPFVHVDAQLTANAGGYVCGSLPAAPYGFSYYPVSNRQLPLSSDDPSRAAYLFIPGGSGALEVVINGAGGAWSGGLSCKYPTN